MSSDKGTEIEIQRLHNSNMSIVQHLDHMANEIQI